MLHVVKVVTNLKEKVTTTTVLLNVLNRDTPYPSGRQWNVRTLTTKNMVNLTKRVKFIMSTLLFQTPQEAAVVLLA